MADWGIVEGLKVVAQVAAPAGLGIGAFLYFARGVLAEKLLPQLTKAQGARVILHVAYLAWSIAMATIVAYVVVKLKTEPAQVTVPVPRPDPSPVPVPGPGPGPGAGPAPTYIPDGRSGWVLVGGFRVQDGRPTADVVLAVKRPTGPAVAASLREYEVGAAVVLLAPTRVRVVDFVNKDWNNAMKSPMSKGQLERGDETGITLPTGAKMVIRDLAAYNHANVRIVWARVADLVVN